MSMGIRLNNDGLVEKQHGWAIVTIPNFQVPTCLHGHHSNFMTRNPDQKSSAKSYKNRVILSKYG